MAIRRPLLAVERVRVFSDNKLSGKLLIISYHYLQNPSPTPPALRVWFLPHRVFWTPGNPDLSGVVRTHHQVLRTHISPTPGSSGTNFLLPGPSGPKPHKPLSSNPGLAECTEAINVATSVDRVTILWNLRSNQAIYVRINPFTFESIHLRSNQSIYVRINPFTFESIHLRSYQSIYVRINPFSFESIHLRANQSIYVRINPFTFEWIHLRSNQSIYVRINRFTFESIHLRSNQAIYVRINPFRFESIHLRSNQSIYVRINSFTFESIHLRSHQSIYVRINPFGFA